MLSNKQLGVIHVARKQLGLDEETYRHILATVAGVATASELDHVGFARLMTAFAQLGFRSTSKAKGFGVRAGMASPAQIASIRKLWGEWANEDASERALNAWIERSYQVSALRFLTSVKARDAITGLRAMVKRKKQAA